MLYVLRRGRALHTNTRQLVYAGDLLYVCVLFVSKLSVCLFFRRLSGSTRKTFLADVITYACAGFGIVSLFTIGLRNRVLDPWKQSPDLSNSTVRCPLQTLSDLVLHC